MSLYETTFNFGFQAKSTTGGVQRFPGLRGELPKKKPAILDNAARYAFTARAPGPSPKPSSKLSAR